MKVIRLISPYRSTNNYLVDIGENNFIGIDIGNIDIETVLKKINFPTGKIVAYFLTHAHADHCMGIEDIHAKFNMPIYCSESCIVEIGDSRKNFSFYSDEIKLFEYNLPFQKVVDFQELNIGGVKIKTILVPGHSPGCAAFLFDDILFTGDFLMLNHKTPLKFPNSSLQNYKNSLDKLKGISDEIKKFYPGHGETFQYISQIKHLS